jgi:hypothetical protein
LCRCKHKKCDQDCSDQVHHHNRSHNNRKIHSMETRKHNNNVVNDPGS